MKHNYICLNTQTKRYALQKLKHRLSFGDLDKNLFRLGIHGYMALKARGCFLTAKITRVLLSKLSHFLVD